MSLLWPIFKKLIRSARRTLVVDDRRKYTGIELLAGSFYLADAIERTTSAKHVGVMLPTSGVFNMTLLATWTLGRTLVPLNYLLSKDELAFVIRDSDIDTIITVGPMLDFVGGPQVLPQEIRLLRVEEEVDFTGFPTPRWPAALRDEDLAVILYTSGTSGRPKGVMLSHGNLHSNVASAIKHARLTKADAFLGVLPQFHTFGLMALTLVPMYLGATAVYTARFIPRKIIDLIRKHRADIFMAVPSMYGALLSAKDAGPKDFESVRLPISGGEPLPDAVVEACRERFGINILEGYGLTETSPAANWSTPHAHKRHSVGPAIPGVRVMIIDETGQVQPPETDGEIVIAGPNVMQGYYKRPDLTEQVMIDVRDPQTGQTLRAFRTGDIGHIDADGFLFITGRKKEMLIIGGENVFPREIEEILNKHPAVKDSAVIGKADGLRGEVPVAFVELVENAQFDEAQARAFVREQLAQYKVPREIHVVDALPRNPTGKILRRQLSAE